MTDMRIKLLIPNVPPLEKVMPYLSKVHERRWFTNFGPLVEELEARLSQFLALSGKRPFIVTTSSCTTGLELAYRVWREYGEHSIGVSAYSFPAAALAAHAAGLKVHLRDVDPLNWTDGSVCAFGIPVDSHPFDNPVVDAAAAIGAHFPDPGVLTVYSMHATKPLPAIEGGFVATFDGGEAEELRRMSNFGFMETTRTAKYSMGHSAVGGYGTNAKLSEYHAAVALASLDEWADTQRRYLALFDLYAELLHPSVTVQKHRVAGRVYPVLAVKLPESVNGRDWPRSVAGRAVQFFAKRGIEVRRWYCPPMIYHNLFMRSAGATPVANHLWRDVLGLPWHLHLSKGEVVEVCDTLRSFIHDELGRGNEE